MDSLTQATLGAAVGEAVLGRKVGNRAILWGAVCGTIPDLDVFVPLGGPVADFTYHRSWSHSIFVLTALTPLVGDYKVIVVFPEGGGGETELKIEGTFKGRVPGFMIDNALKREVKTVRK